jgi:hypothetical protein
MYPLLRLCRRHTEWRQAGRQEVGVFIGLAVVFLVCWILGWVVFHVVSGLIHALLLLALISLIWHFVRARPAM